MPKMKTKSSAKGRFFLTGSGKLRRKHAYKNHLLKAKSKKQKERLNKYSVVETANSKAVRDMLCI